jgi:hypothetical protein
VHGEAGDRRHEQVEGTVAVEVGDETAAGDERAAAGEQGAGLDARHELERGDGRGIPFSAGLAGGRREDDLRYAVVGPGDERRRGRPRFDRVHRGRQFEAHRLRRETQPGGAAEEQQLTAIEHRGDDGQHVDERPLGVDLHRLLDADLAPGGRGDDDDEIAPSVAIEIDGERLDRNPRQLEALVRERELRRRSDEGSRRGDAGREQRRGEGKAVAERSHVTDTTSERRFSNGAGSA